MPIRNKIVYLFGAGASQGEFSHYDPSIRVLMQDIVDGISRRIKKENIESLLDVNNELTIEGIDVEHLITLYESSGTQKHSAIARELKKLFREEIQLRIKSLSESFSPILFASLIEMHAIRNFNEELVAILTINYEDLIERAMQKVKGGINYLMRVNNKHNSYRVKKQSIPILKLHGSFNWKNEYPIVLSDRIEHEEDVLWIPPGVVKRREYYPFSLIWGRAKELLECNILRIIGCSLSRNDWDLISLLYTTQKLRTDGKSYKIELVDSPATCERIKETYKYLNISTILDIPIVRDYLIREYFPHHANKPVTEEIVNELRQSITSDKYNIFAIWLRAMGEKLRDDGISLAVGGENYFENLLAAS
jgi:hypothetical protein